MKTMSDRVKLLGVVLPLWIVATVIVSQMAVAHINGADLAIQQGYTTQAGAVRADDAVSHTGVSDTTNWYRMRSDASGRIIVVGGGGVGMTSMEVQQDTVANATCDATPPTQLTSAVKTCIFNLDAAILIYCDDDAGCSTATGQLIEPRTGYCFDTTAVVRCIAASGTPTVSTVEYAF